MRPIRPMLCGILALCLAGCFGGSAPRDHFYRLEAGAARALGAPSLDGTLEVDRPRSDAITGERLMLFRRQASPLEIDRHRYHQWAEAPRTMVQHELARYLRDAGVAQLVVTPELRVDADYVLGGRVVRLEQLLGDFTTQAVLELEFSLVAVPSGQLMLLKSYRQTRPVAGDAMKDAVAAFADALTAIFEQVTADLSESRG